ncbi:curli assembly protein CsgG [Leptospira perolatii]|uniref:Curli assembly protein CsgG n=2 Tax=Leptospira perolatii TaxID=2023191 RepID=A0A2M9ZPP5_9LEPT|nr:curli assembly protein CsgG [Leptospira perolatii]PJZ74047.1 curli assembly protein CsgG [Leptospira perolatii]
MFSFFFSSCASISKNNKFSDFPDAIQSLSGDLRTQFESSVKASGGKVPAKLAVLNIANEDGIISNLGRSLTDKMIRELFQSKTFILLERDRLNKIIGEQSFQKSGLVLSDEMVSIGKLSGAEYLLLGQISFQDQDFLLNVRIVSLSGVILATSEVVFASNDETFSKFREVSK